VLLLVTWSPCHADNTKRQKRQGTSVFAARKGGLARCFSNKIAVVTNWQYKKSDSTEREKVRTGE